MLPLGLTNVTTFGTSEPVKSREDPSKIRDAARQFEALLIGQMLRSARESSGGWLGSGGESSEDSAVEYAEQQLAATLAGQGGLGLGDLISKGLAGSR